MNVAKKTVKEPEAQTMGGELIDEPKAKKYMLSSFDWSQSGKNGR